MFFMRLSFVLVVLAATLSLPSAIKAQDVTRDGHGGQKYSNCATICIQSANYGCTNYFEAMRKEVSALLGGQLGCTSTVWYAQCTGNCKVACPKYVQALCKVLPEGKGQQCLPQKCFE